MNAPGCHDEKASNSLINVTGKSGRGTARQTVRVDEDEWEKFDATTKSLGTDRSAYLREVIRWANGEPGAQAPTRPDPPAGRDGEED